MTILVTGATGSIGRHLVAALVGGGESVRALTRKPQEAGLPVGVEVVGADLADPSTLRPELFDGIDRVFVFPADKGVDELVGAATSAGVRRFVVLSSLAAAGELPREVRSASYVHHRAVEQAVTSRSDDWTILRPGTFATNLLAWAWPIKSGAPVRAPYLASSQPPIHEADIADAAAVALTRPGHAGRVYALTGPESLTRAEQIAAIGTAIGREIPAVEISGDEFRAETARFIPDDIITMLLEYWSETVSEPDRVRTGGPELTGRPGRTLAQWAADHRADFTP